MQIFWTFSVRAAAAGPLIIAEVSKFCFERNNSCIQNHKGYNESDYMDDWNWHSWFVKETK